MSKPCPDCPHTWKHHKASGRCRPGCECHRGAERAERKRNRG